MHVRPILLLLTLLLTTAACSSLPKPKASLKSSDARVANKFRSDVFELRAKVDRTALIVRPDGVISYPTSVPAVIRIKGTVDGKTFDFDAALIPPGLFPASDDEAAWLPDDDDDVTMAFTSGVGKIIVTGLAYLFRENPIAVTDRGSANGYGTYMIVEVQEDYDRIFFLESHEESGNVYVSQEAAASGATTAVTISTPYSFVTIRDQSSGTRFDEQQADGSVIPRPLVYDESDSISVFVRTLVESWIADEGRRAKPPHWDEWLAGDYP